MVMAGTHYNPPPPQKKQKTQQVRQALTWTIEGKNEA